MARDGRPRSAAVPDLATLIGAVDAMAVDIHGAGSAADKITAAVRITRRLADGEFCAYAEIDGGAVAVRAVDGATRAEVARVTGDHLRRVLHGDETGNLTAIASSPTRTPPRPAQESEVRIEVRWVSSRATAVRAAGQRVRGALVVGHREIEWFTPAHEAALDALARHLGVALDNLAVLTRLAELEAEQREAAHQLQFAVLPPVLAVHGLELGRCYVPADPNSPTGGDLYDWAVLPDGALHLAIVDVVGKGVAATKDALAVAHALRLLTFDGCPLETVVERANRLVTAQNPFVVATVLVARISTETGEVQLAGGGHPPAFLAVTADGDVTQLDAPGVAIGWPGAGSAGLAHGRLGRSDSLVLYTDGLIEAGKDILVGTEHLIAAIVDTARYPAAQFARVLVDRALVGAERRDDSLAVVVRRRIPPPPRPGQRLGPFEHRFSPHLAGIPVARHLLADWLERQPIESREIGDLLLVASELCSNAVKASSGAPRGLALRAWVDEHAVALEVEDDGPGFELPPLDEEAPEARAETGRGLFLVRALMDAVEVRRVNGRTVVRGVRDAIVGGRSPST